MCNYTLNHNNRSYCCLPTPPPCWLALLPPLTIMLILLVFSLCPCVAVNLTCKHSSRVAVQQVLAQLHGVTSDGDAEEEQQEDLPPSQGKEHRRPHSAGNMVEQAATSSSSSSSHRAGRPPLAETTANNKLGLKVRMHSFTHAFIYQSIHQFIHASIHARLC